MEFLYCLGDIQNYALCIFEFPVPRRLAFIASLLQGFRNHRTEGRFNIGLNLGWCAINNDCEIYVPRLVMDVTMAFMVPFTKIHMVAMSYATFG